jgi:UDP-N-acetylmuramyl tripeptide synthase
MPGLPGRTRLAVAAGDAAGRLSRRLGRGQGAVVAGRVTLRIDPEALRRLGAGRQTALVSATNGKTTTTRLLVAAVGGDVATNASGANLPAGMVSALLAHRTAPTAVLETDESYLPRVVDELGPAVVVLLNLSRDQLDRVGEVRNVAMRWRDRLGDAATTVVANADDPLVVWAASTAPRVCWVAAGGTTHHDATQCPECGSALHRAEGSWSCACGLRRPEVAWSVVRDELVGATESGRHRLDGRLPGQINRSNMAMAAVAASFLGVPVDTALSRMADVEGVQGRYQEIDLSGRRLRLLLAKNPAGWLETLLLLEPERPVVLAFNARIADGRDPSWLWDVPFELLRGRSVAITGERWRDLAVRLSYAGIDFAVGDSVDAAVSQVPAGPVDLIANYTAFRDIRQALTRVG